MGTSSSKESKYYAEYEAKLPSLEGKIVAITGCTSGTGLVAAKFAVRKGADVVLMLNRDSSRAVKAEEIVKAELKDGANTVVETISCDLQSFQSVKMAVAAISEKYPKLDVLCNNAGIMAMEDKATSDGYDIQVQTNHLSHFMLTKELFPLLKKATGEARIVHMSSLARSGGPLKAEYFGKNGGDLGGNGNSMLCGGAKWKRYHQTKLANATMTIALAEKLKGTNVIATCAAPGLAQTNLQVSTNETGGMGGGMWMMRFAQSAEDGTLPLLMACFSPEVKNGELWEPSFLGGKGAPKKVKYTKQSTDADQQKMLWEVSEAACGKFVI